MKTSEVSHSPRRITDLIDQKRLGRTVTCLPEFEILPADFFHQQHPYRAFIFLCRFKGKIDGTTYSFRKCYARGCPQNHCAHVSRAVMIANRYLQRDYNRLAKAEIKVEEKLFTLDDMLLKYDGYQQNHDTTMIMEEYIHTLQAGSKVDLHVHLEYVPAVEHFANSKNSQTFLTADFSVATPGKKISFQRCLSCFPTNREREERTTQEHVANARLRDLYQFFAQKSVACSEVYF